MAAINRKKRNSLDLANEINGQTLKLINAFATHTVDKIIDHIERLHVKDTGALRNSIRAVVHAQGVGKGALVSFFMTEYAPYVERALGRYYGVDSDLQDGRGIGYGMHEIPPMGYPPERSGTTFNTGAIPYKPGKEHAHDALREKTHRPRQFIVREINRQLESLSYRLLGEVGNTMEIHILDSIDDALNPLKTGNVWREQGFVIRTEDTAYPTGQTMDY